MIYEKQMVLKWGKAVVENLAIDLQLEYPGTKGFSSRNIWRMKAFYEMCQTDPKLPPMVAEISWAKNIAIMESCRDIKERIFYIKMTKKFGWTKNVLIHQIEGNSYRAYLENQTNFDASVPEKYRNQAKLAVKDEYTFDFLELPEQHAERELEEQLIMKINRFLAEMGGYFSFVGSQYRLEVDGHEFFVDLLFYHRALKCLIALELKTGEYKAEYAGKMQFYLSVLNDRVKLSGENPSIGIILCKTKNRTIVEYSLTSVKHPIGVASYRLTDKLPVKYRKHIGPVESIAGRIFQ